MFYHFLPNDSAHLFSDVCLNASLFVATIHAPLIAFSDSCCQMSTIDFIVVLSRHVAKVLINSNKVCVDYFWFSVQNTTLHRK